MVVRKQGLQCIATSNLNQEIHIHDTQNFRLLYEWVLVQISPCPHSGNTSKHFVGLFWGKLYETSFFLSLFTKTQTSKVYRFCFQVLCQGRFVTQECMISVFKSFKEPKWGKTEVVCMCWDVGPRCVTTTPLSLPPPPLLSTGNRGCLVSLVNAGLNICHKVYCALAMAPRQQLPFPPCSFPKQALLSTAPTSCRAYRVGSVESVLLSRPLRAL